jgi:hypothetical protein
MSGGDIRISFGLAWQDTWLSPRRPGLDSRWRNYRCCVVRSHSGSSQVSRCQAQRCECHNICLPWGERVLVDVALVYGAKVCRPKPCQDHIYCCLCNTSRWVSMCVEAACLPAVLLSVSGVHDRSCGKPLWPGCQGNVLDICAEDYGPKSHRVCCTMLRDDQLCSCKHLVLWQGMPLLSQQVGLSTLGRHE